MPVPDYSNVEAMTNIKVSGIAPSSQLSWLDKLGNYFDRFFQSFGAKAFRVSLGSGVVAGIRYEMFTNVDKSQLRWQERLKYDPYLYYGIQAASIGTGAMAISKLALKAAKNGIRSGYQYAKGKVSKLFQGKVRPPGFENTAEHIFGSKNLVKHKLEPLLDKFGGNQLKATDAIFKATRKAIGKNSLVTSFEKSVRVKGFDLVVRGRVVDGVVRVSTAFKP